ncbi:MAG: hypothetical protein IJ867_06510 [Clostridia bacterium]|nr:hypothetical protein [Clostridia bacterium]
MKKRIFCVLLMIVLMMSMLVGLTACGDDDDDDEESSSRRSKVSRQERDEEILDVAKDVYAEADKIVKENSAKLDEIEIKSFNSVFTPFESDSLSASNVKELISKIVSSNSANSDRVILVEFDGKEYEENEIASLRNKVQNNTKYAISFEYSKNGIIEKVIIKEAKVSGIGMADDEVLKRAQDASDKTKEALARESLSIALSSIQVEFINDFALDQTLSLKTYITEKKLNDELMKQGFYLCSKDDREEAKYSSKAISSKVYITGDDDIKIYEATLDIQSTSVKLSDFEKVK